LTWAANTLGGARNEINLYSFIYILAVVRREARNGRPEKVFNLGIYMYNTVRLGMTFEDGLRFTLMVGD
jgi:hypothetical protein